MSKERELLKQIQQFLLCDCEDIYGFAGDIEHLLAQPDPEPVGIVKTIGGYPDDSVHTVEWLCKYKDIKDGDKLIILKDDK